MKCVDGHGLKTFADVSDSNTFEATQGFSSNDTHTAIQVNKDFATKLETFLANKSSDSTQVTTSKPVGFWSKVWNSTLGKIATWFEGHNASEINGIDVCVGDKKIHLTHKQFQEFVHCQPGVFDAPDHFADLPETHFNVDLGGLEASAAAAAA